MRGADCAPEPYICALSALWLGLLYDPQALQMLDDLTKDWNYEEVSLLRSQVPYTALHTEFRGCKVQDWLKEILQIAQFGLKNRAKLNEDQQNESIYLEILNEVVASGVTEAEKLIKLYKGPWQEQIDMVFTDPHYANPV